MKLWLFQKTTHDMISLAISPTSGANFKFENIWIIIFVLNFIKIIQAIWYYFMWRFRTVDT